MDRNRTITRVLNNYSSTLDSDASKFEILISCFKVFEAITKYRMVSMFGKSFNSFGKDFNHLKGHSILNEDSSSFYVENEHFIYSFKNARNTNSHDSDEVQNIDLNLIRRKTYELLLDFASKDLNLEIPSNLVGYVEGKPQKLIGWLRKNSSRSSFSRSYKKQKSTSKQKDKSSSIDNFSGSHSNEKESTVISKFLTKKVQSTRILIVTLVVVLLALSLYFAGQRDNNKTSIADMDVQVLDSVENDSNLNPKSSDVPRNIKGNYIDMGSGDNSDNVIVGGDFRVNNYNSDSTSR